MRRLIFVLVTLVCTILFAKGAFYVTEYESKTEYQIEYMLDSELHTWVGKKDSVDLSLDKFNLLLSVIEKNAHYVEKLKNQLEISNKQIADLQKELDAAVATMTSLRDRLTEKEKLLDTAIATMTSLRDTLTEKEKLLASQNEIIADLTDKLKQKDNLINNLRQQLHNQEIINKSQNELIEKKNEYISILEGTVPATATNLVKEMD
ncbi:hypothetical protein ACSFC1_09985 [Pseudothermotoga sp. U03pept]|uniref:hypothetical protein n=1 Tax=Pseudothermotoga sp. U03pept TaxID=3447012 RepID=UPI003F087BCC